MTVIDAGWGDILREPGATLTYRDSRKLIQVKFKIFVKLFAIFKDEVKDEIGNELKKDEPKRKKKAVKSNTTKTTVTTTNKLDVLSDKMDCSRY